MNHKNRTKTRCFASAFPKCLPYLRRRTRIRRRALLGCKFLHFPGRTHVYLSRFDKERQANFPFCEPRTACVETKHQSSPKQRTPRKATGKNREKPRPLSPRFFHRPPYTLRIPTELRRLRRLGRPRACRVSSGSRAIWKDSRKASQR